MHFLGMSVLTSIAKILELIQSIIQPTFPTNSQEPDPDVLQFAALLALKLQSIVFSQESLDRAPQPRMVITNDTFLAEVDQRLQSLGDVSNNTRKETFDEIGILFDACVLELKEGTCLPVTVPNRQKISPQQVMNSFYAEIKNSVGINPETLKKAISKMTFEISQDISQSLGMGDRG